MHRIGKENLKVEIYDKTRDKQKDKIMIGKIDKNTNSRWHKHVMRISVE